MNRILLLAPHERAERALFRAPVVVQDGGPIAPGAYVAVIVVNDGTAGTVERLREALDVRERDTRVRLGVLSFLDPADGDVAACVGGLSPLGAALPFDQARALLRGGAAPVSARVTEEAISFEYQV